MQLLYLGKYSNNGVRVSLFLEPRQLVVATVLTGAQTVVQAFKKLVLTAGKSKKGPDLSQLHSLLSSHNATIELVTSKPTREDAERAEPYARKLHWLEFSLRRVEQDLEHEKAEREREKGARDIDEAHEHLRNRKEEIFDLNQKLIHNEREPQLIYSPGKWVQSAWQTTDRIRFQELKDQAKERASAIRQRIDFTRRSRIQELEGKRRDLVGEVEEERKREQEREQRIEQSMEEGVGTTVLVTLRSQPLLVKGRRREALLQSAAEVVREAAAVTRKLADRFGLTARDADESLLLSPLFPSTKAAALIPRAELEKGISKAVASLLGTAAHESQLPNLMRFPRIDERTNKRLAYLGSALAGDLAITQAPMFYDIDQQGVRHTAVVGGSGSGKSVAASLIVEGVALHGVPVLVMDPTGSWAGFAQPCTSEALLKRYEEFRMRRGWARGFDVRIMEVPPGLTSTIDLGLALKESGLTILSSTELTEDQERALAAALLKRLYGEMKGWNESARLRLLIVLEEAHRYLKHAELQPILELFARTARSKGVGLLVVSQVAVDLPPAIRNNVATKIQMQTNYAGDLTRAGQVYGSDVQKLIPRLGQGQGALHFPEYGSTLVAFRPPLHQPSAISRDVATFFTVSKDVERALAAMMKRATPDGTMAQEPQTVANEAAAPQEPIVPQPWHSVVAQRLAQNPAAKFRDIQQAIAAAGLGNPSRRTVYRFLQENRGPPKD